MSQNTGQGTISVANSIQRKRSVNEKKLLDNEPLGYITAYPKEDNPLIWYILVAGQKGTHYEGGHYIGEIHHSPKYPAEPPDYIMRTPSGRYEINKKICLSNSGYHKGEWSATWNIHTILIAFYSIWLDDKEHGISHITRSKAERLQMAKESIQFNNSKDLKDIYSKFNHASLSFDVDNDPRYGKNKKANGETTTANANTNTTNSTTNTSNVEPVKPVETVKPVEPVVQVAEPVVQEKIVQTQIDNIENQKIPVICPEKNSLRKSIAHNEDDMQRLVAYMNQRKIYLVQQSQISIILP